MDFNNDGLLDILAASSNGTINVLFGIGNGTFSGGLRTAPATGQTVHIADLNGDGIPDMVAWGSQTNLMVYRGLGNGRFQTISSTGPFVPYVGTVADFNGDGHADILIATGYPTVTLSVFLNKGDGTFGRPVVSPSPANPLKLVIGDFNGDGKLDLALLTSAYPGTPAVDGLFLLSGRGDGTFTAGAEYPVNPNAQDLAVADFHGNGHLDLLVAQGGASLPPPLLYTGRGDGTFAAPQPLALPGSLYNMMVADFNLDGKPDLAAGLASPGPISGNPIYSYTIFLGQGAVHSKQPEPTLTAPMST
jgi:hypothetical protein